MIQVRILLVADGREDRSQLKMSLCLGDDPATCLFLVLVKRPELFLRFSKGLIMSNLI